MGISLWQILIIMLVVLLLFGAGRLPRLMADFAQGIRNFRAGLKDEDEGSEAIQQRSAEARPQVTPGGGTAANLSGAGSGSGRREPARE